MLPTTPLRARLLPPADEGERLRTAKRSAGTSEAAADVQGVQEQLGRMGVAAELHREIASSIVDDGGEIAMMHGDRLVVEGADSSYDLQVHASITLLRSRTEMRRL